MSDDLPSTRVLAAWADLSARSRIRPIVRREPAHARRPAPNGAGLLATVAIAIAVVGVVAALGRGTGPAASPSSNSSSSSANAVVPRVPGSAAPVSPSPTASAPVARRPGTDVQAGRLVTALDGWALSYGALVVTHDGGRSWTPTAASAPAAERIMNAAFADALHGWVIGELVPAENSTGVLVVNVHRTDDGGATWETVELASIPSPGPDPMVGFPTFSVLSADRVFVMLGLADFSPHVSRLYLTTDGGRSWERRSGVTEVGRSAFLDDAHGWAIRGDTAALVRTVDGGRSWQRAPSPTAPGTDLTGYYPTIPVGTPDNGLVMSLVSGRDGDPARIASSDDVGSTWSVGKPAPDGASGSIAVLGDGTWFLGGRPPRVSHDDGASWESVDAAPLGEVGGVTVAGGSHLSTLVSGPSCGPTMLCYVPQELWISDDAGNTWRNATP